MNIMKQEKQSENFRVYIKNLQNHVKFLLTIEYLSLIHIYQLGNTKFELKLIGVGDIREALRAIQKES